MALKYITAPMVDAKGEPLKAGDLKAGKRYGYRWDGDLKAFVIETTKRVTQRSAPAAKRSRQSAGRGHSEGG